MSGTRSVSFEYLNGLLYAPHAEFLIAEAAEEKEFDFLPHRIECLSPCSAVAGHIGL